jgi:hypothetical protein
VFQYRAVKKGTELNYKWYLFSLSDCPILLWEDAFCLYNKKKSPILLYDTIVRGHYNYNYFEGDIIIDKMLNKELGIVVYNNGFFMQNRNTFEKKPIPDGHIYIVKANKESIDFLYTLNRTPIQFRSSELIFDFMDLVSIINDIILNVLIMNQHRTININMVTELIYYDSTEDVKIYEGDIINGSIASIDNIKDIITK